MVPLISLAIGVSFSCLTFVAHEAVHGGIVRGRAARQLVGWIGFLPFTLSPRLWAAWHDRVHHSSANGSAVRVPEAARVRARDRRERDRDVLVSGLSVTAPRWIEWTVSTGTQ